MMIVCVACSSNNQSKPGFDKNKDHGLRLVSLVVEDIFKSSLWYQEKFGFTEEKSILDYPDYGVKVGFLQLGDFHLELVETKGSIPQSSLPIAPEFNLNGVLKLGFMVQNLDSVYAQLEKYNDVKFITGIQPLPQSNLEVPWPTKHFMLYDPDGNMLQLFSSNNPSVTLDVPEPWLLMLTVDNLENITAWYEKNFGFKYQETVGEVGNQRSILSKGNFILELYRPANVALYDFLKPKTEYQGFRKVGFAVDSIELESAKLAQANTQVVMPLRGGDMTWSAQSMIVKDLEGNWVQLLESTN